MNLASIKALDIVQCDVKGRVFYAIVAEKHPRGLKVEPITKQINYGTVTARQVTAHWRRSRQSTSREAARV